MYAYVCVCVKLKHISVKYSKAYKLNVHIYMYVVILVVHVKFRILKYGKYIHFIMAMNMVLLAVCSPIFPAGCP